MAQSLPSMQALPAPIAQLAAAHQLGPFVTRHKASAVPPGIILSLISLLVGIWLLAFNQGEVVVVILGLLFLALGCWMPVRQFLNRSMSVYVFAEGLIAVKGTHSEVVPWSQVESLWQSSARYGLNILFFIPLLRIVTRVYRLRLADGRTLSFNRILEKVEALGEAIASGSGRYLLPRAIATYQAGVPVQFGPFSVSQQGISQQQQLIPWNYYERIMLGNGRTWIQYQQGKRSRRVAIKEVPNFSVFIGLVSYITHGRPR